MPFDNQWQADWTERVVRENPRQPREGYGAYTIRIAQLAALSDVEEVPVTVDEERMAIQAEGARLPYKESE